MSIFAQSEIPIERGCSLSNDVQGSNRGDGLTRVIIPILVSNRRMDGTGIRVRIAGIGCHQGITSRVLGASRDRSKGGERHEI